MKKNDVRRIEVRASRKYDVLIGRGLLDDAGRYISEACRGRKALIVSDSNVSGIYAGRLERALEAEGISTAVFIFPAGEKNKNGNTLMDILDFTAKSGLTREDLVIAVGGGVTGDMAGLAAAMYMRGIDYVQIPTSILAAVDSSVGGKTAIDLPQGKNLAGAFHQPSIVIIDTDVFGTLPGRDYRNGFAEVIKYGMISDPQILRKTSEEACASEEDLADLIATCVGIKAAIVEDDEFESGKRQLLNFGHTIGHAVEKASDYEICHGEAVAIGMMLITEAAVRKGLCEDAAVRQLRRALERYSLPTENTYNKNLLMEYIAADKKNTADGIKVVIPEKAGRCSIENMSMEELAEFI